MTAWKVTIFSQGRERLAALQRRVESSVSAQLVLLHSSLPASSGDPILLQLREVSAQIAIVEIPPEAPQAGIRAVEVLHGAEPTLAIIACGVLTQPRTIISVMRAGACEFLDRDLSPADLVEALTRLSSSTRAMAQAMGGGRVYTFLGAKGGVGTTTLAVNTAITLQKRFGSVALVDLAGMGHCALHMNLKPRFALPDATRNLRRLDATLLEGCMTDSATGLRVLAAGNGPAEYSAAHLERIFELLIPRYRYVVVDCSSRVDQTSPVICDTSKLVLLIAQMDVVSLWSASRIQEFLSKHVSNSSFRLLINRYRKGSGWNDEDLRATTKCEVFWKIPNQFRVIGSAVDRGIPATQHGNTEISQCFEDFAAALVRTTELEDELSRSQEPVPSAKKGLLQRLDIASERDASPSEAEPSPFEIPQKQK
ncbi:MAG TPA: hypothetical protein VFA76_14725 [Terriglobales bacterium]|nr:hypothetical protein [Terriglobales bacterium]